MLKFNERVGSNVSLREEQKKGSYDLPRWAATRRYSQLTVLPYGHFAITGTGTQGVAPSKKDY